MKSLNDILKFAINAHRGQIDKSGIPYIEHPFRVMTCVEKKEAKVVALLHDVVEDTKYTLPDIVRELELPNHIADAIFAITRIEDGAHPEWHSPYEPYKLYIARVKKNSLARTVKIVDIMDNLSPLRMAKLDRKTQNRLRKKYVYALKELDIEKPKCNCETWKKYCPLHGGGSLDA